MVKTDSELESRNDRLNKTMKGQQYELLEYIKKQMDSSVFDWGSDFTATLRGIGDSEASSEIKSVDHSRMISSYAKCKHFNRIPVSYLPNCALYESRKNMFSLVDELFGNYYRLKKEGSSIVGFKNNASNKYIQYQFNRLGHLRDQGLNREYWRVAMGLLKTPAYQVMCFNKVNEGWYKNLKIENVREIYRKVKDIVNRQATRIEYKRVYIAKSNGKVRPLGVPTKEWRVYLNMLNNLVVWFRIDKIESQHAYITGRGVQTAWAELYGRLEKEDNIYEFDLKGFFDNVDLLYTEREMTELGVPAWVSRYFRELNQSIVKLTAADQLDESANRKVIYDTDGSLNPNFGPSDIASYNRDPRSFESDKQSQGFQIKREIGVPQGASTSCGLSTINLKDIIGRNRNRIVMYADDGLLFPPDSKSPISLDDKSAGVIHSIEKSGWVKTNGVWKSSLKFLGLRYVPTGLLHNGRRADYPRLEGATRGGSTLEFNELRQFQCYLNERFKRAIHIAQGSLSLKGRSVSGFSLRDWVLQELMLFSRVGIETRMGLLFRSETGSRLLSCIYNNSWSLNLPQENASDYAWGSWLHRRSGSYLYSMSSSLLSSILDAKLDLLLDSAEDQISIWSDPRVDELSSLLGFLRWSEYLVTDPHTMELIDMAKDSLFKGTSFALPPDLPSSSKENFLDFRKSWVKIFKKVQLDGFNSSTHACHDLLRYAEERTLWKEKEEIYCKLLCLKVSSKLRKSQLVAAFAKRGKNLTRKLKREFKQQSRKLTISDISKIK